MSKKNKIDIEQFDDVLIAWEKDLHVPHPETKQPLYLGTVIRINNTLTALAPYSDSELNMLETAVIEAIAHERKRRSKERA